MKLLLKAFLSLLVGGVCLWFALRKIDLGKSVEVLRGLSVSLVLFYVLTLIPVHILRAWRWKYLLRPLGVAVPFPKMMLLSTVGFMAILALPFRLGEFVRPYYVVKTGQSRMSEILGTVAVERIVDGLFIAILFFATYLFAHIQGEHTYSPILAFSAWLSLLGFLGLTCFLGFSLRWPKKTIQTALSVLFIKRLSPRLAHKLEDKLGALIQGFRALGQPRHLLPFLFHTTLYWACNGLGMWLLARGMGLPIPLHAAFAAMALTGVLISLPNAPGLVGQFHAGILLALAAYVPETILSANGGAYAVALHGIQFVWYVLTGLLALPFASGGFKAFRAMIQESKQAAEENPPLSTQ